MLRGIIALGTAVPLLFLGEATAGPYLILAGATALTIASFGIRRNSTRPGPWWLIELGGVLLLVSLVARGVHAAASGEAFPFPSPADAFATAGYLLLLSGGALLAHRRQAMRGTGDVAAAVLLGLFLAMPFWLVILSPYVENASFSPGHKALNISYSVIDIALITVVAQLATGPGRRNPSYYLFTAAIGSIIALDTFAVMESVGLIEAERLLMVLAVWGFALFAAAMLDPKLDELDRHPDPTDPRLTNGRLLSISLGFILTSVITSYFWFTTRGNLAIIPATLMVSATALTLVRIVTLFRSRERLTDFDHAITELQRRLLAEPDASQIRQIAVTTVQAILGPVLKSITLVAPDEEPAVSGTRPGHHVTTIALPGSPSDGDWQMVLELRRRPDTAESLGIQSVAAHLSQALQALELHEVGVRERMDRRFRALIEQSSDAIFVIDEDQTIVLASPSAEGVVGRGPDELVGTSAGHLFAPSEQPMLDRLVEQAATGQPATSTRPFGIQSEAGTTHLAQVSARDLRSHPEVSGVVLTVRDVTDEWLADEALRASEARFKALVQHSSDLVAVLDEVGRFVYVSPSSESLLGVAAEELLGQEAIQFVAPEHRNAVTVRVTSEAAGQGQPQHMELHARTVDGHPLILDATFTDLSHDPAVGGVVLNARDITVSHKLESDLRFAAYHDSLTGLANRLLLLKKIEEARNDAGVAGLAVLLIDLDDFKTINDGLGHSAGDEVLNIVAGRLRGVLRLRDTAARLGGDEFAILLTECYSDDDVLRLADRVLEALAEPLSVSDRVLHLTASVGISVAWGEYPAPQVMLRDADAAMYKAKQAGKNRAELFETSLQETAIERLELSADLRRALDQDELFLVYQPIVELRTGMTVGLEALVRWAHPTRGTLAPGSFIELAEATGLIVPLGRWVLTEACRQINEWDHDGVTVPTVSVNVSARQLDDPNLIPSLLDAMSTNHVSPERLCIEVTESLLIDDSEHTMSVLRNLHTVGVSIAVDDFGTGYSSLSYLRRYPFDRLKIDRAFVQALEGGTQERDVRIVQAIVDLAESLEVDVVAEGIERPEEARLLHELGCSLGQGYLYSRPADPTEIAGRLRAETNAALTAELVNGPADRSGNGRDDTNDDDGDAGVVTVSFPV